MTITEKTKMRFNRNTSELVKKLILETENKKNYAKMALATLTQLQAEMRALKKANRKAGIADIKNWEFPEGTDVRWKMLVAGIQQGLIKKSTGKK